MPLFSIDIEKRLGSEFWTNRYIVNLGNFSQGTTIANDLLTMERAFHATPVAFTRWRLSDPNSEQYVISPVNLFGQRSISGDTLLPLFNTLRVDISAATGRPSRKYYRGVLAEGDISGDAVVFDVSGIVTGITAQLSTGPAVNGIVDPQGELLTVASVHPFVQMRQLRRSRRRRTNGGGVFQ